ncbi:MULTISPECIES: TetR/AcrR family transcriptional regulator [unclassified Curtobacterium]|uniref:TetR/AcrR family transcriptional regulator n=1 Tax=unclassified Curtobacterium TaxID=257496 RepID=UPI000DA9ABB5|nr:MULTISPECIES: TetR/AcrR family transcriptional regulator [unclassified Curtobacterium]PZE25691.1 TetR/AcrR family transcriptional regulator [Curtobacterium sp. MCBD17_028]PZE78440.1 TetR/AcrR family transcriptional regulator [Curtobacterium sp. MCBD17_019]PZF57173.1 TetR/AcrR family transcriptional regulator [Curtobacterium sp. MCBD17_034]PZF63316.1 TetR/AcrR family transcriptional regulator [Curtobacterium sp. MCBD17_013]PZM33477.1 TetR/AcrR family transcriptional regulator [Curtobacterium
MTLESQVPSRTRDAAKTRQLLVAAARRRFAYDGYSATTVREIAADAGVNVALINRYFTSKEGLFEACLERAVEDLDAPRPDDDSVERMLQSLVERVTNAPTGEHAVELLLLIRSSGDEQADRIRNATLTSYAERMARIAGWDPDDVDTNGILLRAEVALATAFGITLLRASTRLGPLVNASASDLTGPFSDVVTALLAPDRR